MVLVTLSILVLVVILFYKVLKPYTYWFKRNVTTGTIIPIFGDNFHLVFGWDTFPGMIQRIYNKIPNARYSGSYQFITPVLVIRSPELIKRICVKDHFMDHRPWFPEKSDEILAKSVCLLKGKRWKYMRSCLSPTFTSSKVKGLFTLMRQNAVRFVQHFIDKNQEVVEIDVRDVTTRYSTDIIASAALGLQVDSLKDRKNGIHDKLEKIFDFTTYWTKFVFLSMQFSPSLTDYLGLAIFGETVKTYFLGLVREAIKLRKGNDVNHTDLLGHLIETRQEKKNEINKEQSEKTTSFSSFYVQGPLEKSHDVNNLTELDIASQAFAYMLGGLDTIGTAMFFTAYELALNPDIQGRLIEEIDENRQNDGSTTYECIANLPYLDMVINESLRKWPIIFFTDRAVTKPYTIEPELEHEKPLHLELNDAILIPIYAIHNDSEIYENPEKFDPERFSSENKKNINPYTYMPFGIGPRNCVANRLAIIEIKTAFFHLLGNFEIVPVEKTQIPIKLSKTSFNLKSERNIFLGLKRRNHNYTTN